MRPGVYSISLKDFISLSAEPPPRRGLALKLGYADQWIEDVISGARKTPELEKILGIWKPERIETTISV